MSVRLQLCFAVLFLAAVEADEGRVDFWLKKFKMTCPEIGDWFEENQRMGHNGETLELDYKDKRKYHCTYDIINDKNKYTYYFYVQGKGCDNCFELDGVIFMAIILVDMGLTMVVMAIVYKWAKRKSSAGRPHTPKAGPHPGGRAPPVPSPDYERLNPHTLSQGTYSEVHTNRAN